MAGQDDSDKTEKPTQKKLRDARRKGDVAKSRDLGSTAGLAACYLLAVLAAGWAGERIAALMDAVFAALHQPFEQAVMTVGAQALQVLLALAAAVVLPVAAAGAAAEFLQVGPLFALDKLRPKAEHLNPASGMARWLSADKLVEIAKALAKTVLLLVVGWLVVKALLPGLARLPWAPAPAVVGSALWAAAQPLLAWAVALFALLSVADVLHQRMRFMKRMRMSRRDLKQEAKDQAGDPHIKAQRRRLHEDWSQRNAAQAAGKATALLVNPTHVAIAIDYDREICPVPTVSAKGEDEVARAMREAAEDAGVPIVRNVVLARDLLARAEVGELVPADLFDVIAEVILWAREVRDELAAQREEAPHPPRQRRPPGEDLTRYAQPPV